jgi:hypothetical protein
VVQQQVIEDSMLDSIDGIECWHTRMDTEATSSYLRFARTKGLMVTGGSDCHQQPIIIGTVAVPDFVADQFLTREEYS